MGFKSVVLALALFICLAVPALAVIPLGPKNFEPTFPTANMSGNEILNEVRGGVYTDANDSELSFLNESLFYVRKDTGMRPGIPEKGVRTPSIAGLGVAPAAGVWAFTLTDTGTRYLTLTLSQFGDAVSGTGELNVNGVKTPVTVGGTVLGDRLAMYAIPTGSQGVYRFSLLIRPGSMDGNYIFSAQGIEQPGVVFGNLVAPQTISPVVSQQTQTAVATQQTGTQQGY
jgi:hypothetical protein